MKLENGGSKVGPRVGTGEGGGMIATTQLRNYRGGRGVLYPGRIVSVCPRVLVLSLTHRRLKYCLDRNGV